MNAKQTDDLNKKWDYYFYSEPKPNSTQSDDIPEFITDGVEEILI